MRAATIVLSAALAACGASANARAQQADSSQAATASRPTEPRVPLGEPAVAYDAAGQTALAARLRTTQLTGSVDAPVRNARIVIDNRGGVFYTHASGWATFYDAQNVRCGEGLWKAEALAAGESAEVDTPGLRLTCAPVTWRIVATNLLTRTSDALAARPAEAARLQTETTAAQGPPSSNIPPLEININGKTIPIQPGNPLEVTVGKERVRIVVNPAP